MATSWHLLKSSDHSVHGPVDIEQLRAWAAEAKISPFDKVSCDDHDTWVRAPMVPELQMDWLIEMRDNYLYGPTTVGAIQEFLATGEIDENVCVIDCVEGLHGRLADQPFYQVSPHQVRSASTVFHGTDMPGTSEAHEAQAALKQRVLWLERQVMELQRELAAAEDAQASLRAQFIEATGNEPL
jgi:hypothetical protein